MDRFVEDNFSQFNYTGGISMKKREQDEFSFKYPSDVEYFIQGPLRKEIEWHEKKSDFNQNCFHWMQIFQITFGSAIPVLTGFSASHTWILWIVGILGGLVTAITGFSKTFQFQELWIQYRTTKQSLERELQLFQAKCKPYDEADYFQVFVERIEGILGKENVDWNRALMQKQKNQTTKNTNTALTEKDKNGVSF